MFPLYGHVPNSFHSKSAFLPCVPNLSIACKNDPVPSWKPSLQQIPYYLWFHWLHQDTHWHLSQYLWMLLATMNILSRPSHYDHLCYNTATTTVSTITPATLHHCDQQQQYPNNHQHPAWLPGSGGDCVSGQYLNTQFWAPIEPFCVLTHILEVNWIYTLQKSNSRTIYFLSEKIEKKQ